MLRYGIPEYRLPKAVLDAEIDTIRALGVEIRCGVRVGCGRTVSSLLEEGHDAVLLAAGAQRGRMMRIEGENLPGVLSGIDFLAGVAGGERPTLGADVIVVGGGDTAIDAARTALRLGAKRVTIVYRRSREEMPATSWEIAAAEEEGIEIRYLTLPVSIARADGPIEVSCARMALGAPDESGRRKPVPVEGSRHAVSCDTVIMAIGQSVDPSVLEGSGIAAGKGGVIPSDDLTLETGRAGIFSAGDCVTGPDIAIGAVAAGRRAAFAIDSWLRTGKASPFPALFSPARRKNEEIAPDEYAGEEKLPRVSLCHAAAAERTEDFREVERAFGEEDALREAYRCLECGCDKADDCSLRDLAREYGADGSRFGAPAKRWKNDDRHPYIVRDPDKCIKCARCVRVCLEVQGIGAWGYVGRGLEMQIAPPFGRPLQDTDCESCGQCLTACPTGALSENGPLPFSPEKYSSPVETTCGHCGDGCAVTVSTAGNRVAKISPVENGNLCEKGKFGCAGLSGTERIVSPLVRRGAMLRPAGWAEAVAAVREGLRGARPRRIAVFVSPRLTDAEAFEAQRIARAVLGTNNIYPASGAVFSAAARARLESIVSPWSAGDIEKSDAVVVVGPRIVESNRVAALSVIAAARRGARILVVGGNKTKLDRIAAEKLRVSPDCFAAYGREIAAFLRGARRPAIVFNRDGLTEKAILSLHRLARKSGAGIVSLAAEANGQGLLDAGVSPVVLPGQRPVTDRTARRALEKEWGSRIPAWRGMDRAELLSAMRRGEIRAALFLGGLVPDGDRELAAALRKIPFVLMQALAPSPLTRLARVLLPAASWAESRGTFTRYDGVKLSVRPALPPLCGSTNAEIWRLLFPGYYS
jgi:formate dehydrogenase major subunit